MRATLNFFLIFYVLLQLGYIFSFGNYSYQGIYVLIGSLILWLVYFFKSKPFEKHFNFSPVFPLYFVLGFSSIFSLMFLERTLLEPGIITRPENIYQLIWTMRFLLVANMILAFFFFHFKNRFILFSFFIISAVLLRILIITASPNPRIDVFDFLKLGSQGLIGGLNPYQITYIPIYPNVVPNYFTYLPGILILTTPFVAIFGDHRYLFAALEIATAFIIYALLNKTNGELKTTRYLLPAIYLFNPVSLFIVLRGWIDSAIIFIFALFAFLVVVKKSEKLAFILLGYIITTKQLMIFAPIFLAKWAGNKLSKFIPSLVTASLIVLPFFLWGPKDFIEDVVLFFISYPARYDGMTVNSLFYNLTKINIPNIAFVPIWVIAALTIWHRQKNSLDGAFLAMSLWYFIFFLFNKLAFVNYYYFVSSLVLLYLTVKIALAKR